LRTLAEEDPAAFVRYALDAERLLGAHRTLDAKTGELVAIAAATAMQCDHCIKAHIGGARANGATWPEIFDTILIAAHTTESSALAVALRSYKQEKARHLPASNQESMDER
jgi:AhpD family alkylhydroperoxidase